MFKKELPVFYYHDHFMEFLNFIEQHCSALLHNQHNEFLIRFKKQSKQTQALLVRLVNRKQMAIKVSSLNYVELDDIQAHIEVLKSLNWIRSPEIEDYTYLISAMTKTDLCDVLNHCNATVKPKSSMQKNDVINLCYKLPTHKFVFSPIGQSFLVKCVEHTVDYFLYLYFGNVNDRLNKFSMRDLGIMRTRADRAQFNARFESKEQAYSEYLLDCEKRHLKNLTLTGGDDIIDILQKLPEAIGEKARMKREAIEFNLACKLIEIDAQKAIKLLANLASPDAQEKWCREAFKLGHKVEVLEKLQSIMNNPANDKLAYFAEDFMARKFNKKRTSQLTDMLRKNSQRLTLDEIHKGKVEQGVASYYVNNQDDNASNVRVYHSENHLWQSLFLLTFWQEIFDTPGLGLATEFDYMPECLKQNTLYLHAGNAVDKKLNEITSSVQWLNQINHTLCKNFSQTKTLCNVNSGSAEQIAELVNIAPIPALKYMMKIMAKDWQSSKDGFPDLFIIENDKFRFEEIKAEGDVLRRNQLMRIQQLRNAGIDVRITKVEFAIDPNQPYTIVDIETTGGNSAHHRITEIGMIKMVNGEIIDEWQSLVNPQRHIPKQIESLTGISDAMVADAPLFCEIADDIDKFTQNSIFVAHNVNFDYGFIREEFTRLERHWRRPKVCTVQQMRKYFKGLKSYSLANLTKEFGISMTRHHRAMSDAIAAGELLKLINAEKITNQNQL